MNYPEWAPSSLIPLHEKFRERLSASTQEDNIDVLKEYEYIYRVLLLNDDMESVWNTLKRHWKSGVVNDDEKIYTGFISSVVNAYHGPSNDWEGIPRAERATKAKSCAKAARELVRMITPTLNESVVGLVPLKSVKDGFSNILEQDQYKQAQQASQEDWEKLRSYLAFRSGFRPGISEVLMEWAKWLDIKAMKPAILPNPNSQNAEVIYFIRSLSQDMRFYCDTPLHEVVAKTASAIFQERIDKDYVRLTVSRSPVQKQKGQRCPGSNWTGTIKFNI